MTDSELLTVSLGTWMELPNLSMKDWRPDVIKSVGGRINVSTVAAYYKGNLLWGIDNCSSAAQNVIQALIKIFLIIPTS